MRSGETVKAAVLFLVAACSSAPTEHDAGDAYKPPPPPDDASLVDVYQAPETGGYDAPVQQEAAPPPIECADFFGIDPKDNIQQPCTGSNWTFDTSMGAPLGPCSSVTCPSMNGRICSWNGYEGTIECPP
jgi:hypothetical protein